MQSALAILSPSSPPVAKAVAGPVIDPEADPRDGFGGVLASVGGSDEDDEVLDSPPVDEVVRAAANPVLTWLGAVVTAAGAEGSEPEEAVALVDAVSRSGMRDAHPASVAPEDASLPAPAEAVSGQDASHGGRLGIPPAGHAVPLAATGTTGPDEAAIGGMERTAGTLGSPAAAPDRPGPRQAWGLAASDWQAETPAETAELPALPPDQAPVAVSGPAGAGRSGTTPVDAPWGPIASDEGPAMPPARADAVSAPPGWNVLADLPVRTGAKAGPGRVVDAAQPEGAKVSQAMPDPGGMAVGAGMTAEQVSAPEEASQGAARAGTGDRPSASFWERLFAGMIDGIAPATTAGDTAGPTVAARPADGPETPQAVTAGLPPAIVPVSPTVAVRPGAAEAGAPIPTGGAVSLLSSAADPDATDRDRFPSDFAPKASSPKIDLHAVAVPGTPAAAALRIGTSRPDAIPEAFDDPGPFTVPGTTPFAPQPGPVPAAAPVQVPPLAAQVTAALTRGADGATELSLAPVELGHVRVKLKPDVANPDRLVVMITFERPETLDLFRRHAGELTDALRAAGYSGAELGFGQEGRGQAGTPARDHAAGRSFDDTVGSDPVDPPQPTPRHSGAASLDLRL